MWGMGIVFNGPCALINSTDGGGRHRYDQDALTLGTPVIKSRGAVLTVTTDYTNPAAGVIRMVSAQADPVTYDVSSATPSFPSLIAQEVLLARGGYESSDLSLADFDSVARMVPLRSSYWTDQDVTAKDVLDKLIKGSGGYIYETHEGTLGPSILLPPPGPNPRGGIYTAEFRKGGEIIYTDIADQTGSFSIACWIKPWRVDADSTAPDDEFVVSKLSSTTGYWLKLPTASNGQVSFGFRAASADYELKTNEGVLKWGVLQFICGVFDATADTMTIYWALEGSSLVEVATVGSITAVPSGNSENLSIASVFMGVLGEISVWSKALSKVEAQGIMDSIPVVPTSNLSAFIPLNEGSGNPIEYVSSTSSSFGENTLWQPAAVFDLTQDVDTVLHVRRVQQARRVRVRYRHNYRPMTPADIVSSVSLPNRWDLIRPYRSVTSVRKNVDAHPRARDIEIHSQVVDNFSARRIARLILNRMSGSRQVGFLGGLDKRCLKLVPGLSEVHVVSNRYGLSSGGHFRVTNADRDLGELEGSALLWR